jgi:hypothetical protein
VARALLAHDGHDSAGDVHRAEEARGKLALDLLGRQLLEVARVEVGGVVDQHVDAAEAVNGRRDRRLGVVRAGDVELDDQEVVGLADRLGDGVGIAAGCDDRMAGGQRGLGEVDAHVTPGAGDEPRLRLSHGHHASAESAEVGVPVERVLRESPRHGPAGLRSCSWTPGAKSASS